MRKVPLLLVSSEEAEVDDSTLEQILLPTGKSLDDFQDYTPVLISVRLCNSGEQHQYIYHESKLSDLRKAMQSAVDAVISDARNREGRPLYVDFDVDLEDMLEWLDVDLGGSQ